MYDLSLFFLCALLLSQLINLKIFYLLKWLGVVCDELATYKWGFSQSSLGRIARPTIISTGKGERIQSANKKGSCRNRRVKVRAWYDKTVMKERIKNE